MVSPAQIRAARALLDVSQTDLAAWVGISKTALTNIETGAATPRIATAAAIQRAFETRGVAFSETGVYLVNDMQKMSVWEHLARQAGKLPRSTREDDEADQPVRKASARREPDRETDYDNWCRYKALQIANAGRAARNLPLLKNLGGEIDDNQGDDDKDFDSDDDKKRGAANPATGESEAEYWKRVNATAAAIVRAGKRRRNEIP